MKRMVTGLRGLEKFDGETGENTFTEFVSVTGAIGFVYHFVAASRKSVNIENTFKDLFRHRHEQRGGVA